MAESLHTLDLLSGGTTLYRDGVRRCDWPRDCMPTDDILSAATALLERTPTTEDDTADKLRQILAGVRSIKCSIRSVGEALAPPRVSNARDSDWAEKLRNFRVLLLDADERIRRSAHGLIERYCGQVETWRTAQEALALARSGTYDAILLDVKPPDLSGYETYKQLQAAQPTARLIMMTAFGYDSAHSIVKARADGLRLGRVQTVSARAIAGSIVGPEPAPLASAKSS